VVSLRELQMRKGQQTSVDKRCNEVTCRNRVAKGQSGQCRRQAKELSVPGQDRKRLNRLIPAALKKRPRHRHDRPHVRGLDLTEIQQVAQHRSTYRTHKVKGQTHFFGKAELCGHVDRGGLDQRDRPKAQGPRHFRNPAATTIACATSDRRLP
jgi:hypothetical protein